MASNHLLQGTSLNTGTPLPQTQALKSQCDVMWTSVLLQCNIWRRIQQAAYGRVFCIEREGNAWASTSLINPTAALISKDGSQGRWRPSSGVNGATAAEARGKRYAPPSVCAL